MWRARTSLARAAPWALATTWSRSFSSPAGLALAARTTTTVLNIQSVWFQEEPTAASNKFRLVLAGTALGALMSSEVECAPKKRPKTASSKPAAAKKPGPALPLGAIEAALHPEKTYDVEKFSRALSMSDNSLEHELLALANTDCDALREWEGRDRQLEPRLREGQGTQAEVEYS